MLCRVLVICFLGVGISSAYDKDVLLPGDIILGGLFSIQTFGTAHCNRVDSENVQIYEAVRWFLRTLNDRNYLTNAKFGLHGFNTCDEPPHAVAATLNMLEVHKDRDLYGVLGPGRSSETQYVSRMLSSLPEENRLPQLSFSATAATLSDKSVYTNLLRVIVPDNMQIEVLHQLVLSLKWNYIAIVYEMDTYGIEGATALRGLAEKSGICVPVYFGVATEASAEERRVSFVTLKNKLEKELESPVIGLVFIGLGPTVKVMFEYLNLELANFQVIVSEALGLNEEYLQNGFKQIYPRAKGVLTLSPPLYDTLAFKDYWVSLHNNETALLQQTKDNNWLLKYMETVTGCQLENATQISPSCLSLASASDDVNLSFYISYALTAVASFAKTIKGIYTRLCPLQNGVCTAMRNIKRSNIIAEMRDIKVTSTTDFPELSTFNRSFEFTNGEITYLERDGSVPTYNVYNYQTCDSGFCFRKIGNHVKGQLLISKNMTKSYDKNGQEKSNAVEAQCQSGFNCQSCEASVSQGEVIFIPGDFYVIGLAPIHDQGSGSLQCGNLRTSIGVDMAESIVYAIRRVNLKRDRFVSTLGNKVVGLVLIDTCNNALVTRERVIKLERGELQLTRQLNSSSIAGKIIGYVGPYGSAVSVPVSAIMAELNRVFISYASTSSSLTSRSTHPTFMRTCSPDYKQANVIMYIAKEMNTQYVQVMYTDEEYGRSGFEELKISAKSYKICIAQNLSVPDARDATIYRKYVSELRRYPHAKVVILFCRAHVTPLLVKTLTDDLQAKEFIFIGAEGWGKRPSMLVDNEKYIGTLTLAQELPKNEGFEDYFRDIYVPETNNPWLRNYLEEKAGCYYPMSFNKISGQECSPTLIEKVHQTDSWVPFAINAVYSLVLGFSRTLQTKCFGALSICPQFTTAALINNTREVYLDLYNDGGNVRVFDENNDGRVGYTISQLSRNDQNVLIYKKVGDSYEDRIQFFKTLLDPGTNFETNCKNDLECERCRRQFNESAVLPTADNNYTVIGLGVLVAILLIVIIVFIVLAVLWWKRNASKPAKDTGKYPPVARYEESQSTTNNETPSGGYITAFHNGDSDSYVDVRDSVINNYNPGSADGYSYLTSGTDNPGLRLENESESGFSDHGSVSNTGTSTTTGASSNTFKRDDV